MWRLNQAPSVVLMMTSRAGITSGSFHRAAAHAACPATAPRLDGLRGLLLKRWWALHGKLVTLERRRVTATVSLLHIRCGLSGEGVAAVAYG